MDAVTLQNFMRLRDAAATRIQSSPQNTPVKNLGDWRTAIESKRLEMGIATRSSTSYAVNDFRDIEVRAESLKSKMSVGTPVRKTGNLLDIRA